MKKCPYNQSIYEKEEDNAWNKWVRDMQAVAGLLHDLSSFLESEPYLEEPWENLKLEDKQMYWKLFRALERFLDLLGCEGEKATQLDNYQIRDILTVIHEQGELAEEAESYANIQSSE